MSENKRLFVGRKKVADRFTIILDYDDEIGVKENQSGDVIVLKHNDLNAQQFVAQLVIFLNDQNQAITDLHDGFKYWSDKASERITLLEKENEQLKEENNRLKQDNEKTKESEENKQLKSKERYCVHCKHLYLDRIVGMWCDIHEGEWGNIDAEYCPDYEKE